MRPCLLAALVYAVLSLVLISPALVPGRTLSSSDVLWHSTPWIASSPPGIPGLRELGDQALVFEPFLLHTRSSLPHIPLWDSAIMAGRPFLADGQSAVFSPFSAPAYALPFWWSLGLMAALKLFVAAFGTYLLGRALGMRFGGALLAGVVFAFSFWFVAWLSWPNTSVWAFLPWLWLLADRLARRADLLAISGLASVIGLQYLGGHPESSFDVLAFTAVFFVLRLVQHRHGVGSHPRLLAMRLGGFLSAVILGTALAALALVPLLELLNHSADVSNRASFGNLHIPSRYLLGIFLHDYWGRATRTVVDFQAPYLHDYDRAFYVGALTLMLTFAALVVRPSLERAAIAVVGAGALLVVVGASPVFGIVKALPGFSVSQNTRLVVVVVLCVALLAGWGLDELVKPTSARKRQRATVVVAVVVLVTPIIWVSVTAGLPSASLLGNALRIAWGFATPPHLRLGASPQELASVVGEIRLASLLEWLLLAAAGAALVTLRLADRLRAPAFAGLAILLIVADLFKADMGFNPAIAMHTAIQPTTPALHYLQARRPNRFVGLVPTEPFAVNPLPSNIALRYGLFDARGYDYPIENRYFRFWREEIAPGACAFVFCTTGAGSSPQALRALSLLSVSDLLQGPTEPLIRTPGLSVAYSGPDGRVYANSRAVPRVFVVDRQVVVSDADSAFRATTSPAFRARRVAVSEDSIPGVRESPDLAGQATYAGGAQLTSYGDERVVVRAAARRPSILVLTDTYYPGWKATVDGKSVPVHRIDYLLRGIRLAPGSHRVEFRYQPASWRVGRIVSALALVVVLVMAGVGYARSRRLKHSDARLSPGGRV